MKYGNPVEELTYDFGTLDLMEFSAVHNNNNIVGSIVRGKCVVGSKTIARLSSTMDFDKRV